jgi:hypothetical protein
MRRKRVTISAILFTVERNWEEDPILEKYGYRIASVFRFQIYRTHFVAQRIQRIEEECVGLVSV